MKSCTYKIPYTLILSLSFTWCALFIGAALLAQGNSFSQKAYVVITLFFSSICHQAAERSFHFFGHPMAVCIRCASNYGGFLLVVVLYPFMIKWNRQTIPQRRILFLAIILAGMDFFLSRLSWNYPDPLFRIMSGMFLGGVAAFFVIPALCQTIGFRKQI